MNNHTKTVMAVASRLLAARSAAAPIPVALSLLVTLSCSSIGVLRSGRADDFGLMVMAHGGTAEWNQAVLDAVEPLRDTYRLEVAFGMADAASIQQAIERLEAQGVRRIGVIRLFVSGDSWYERTRQILGLSDGAPDRWAVPESEHPGHRMSFWRVDTHSSFALTREGLSEADEVATVLVDRARAVSRTPKVEDVLILAHGAGDDAENERWLVTIGAQANAIREQMPFRRVEVLTLREDWPEKRKAAEERIRAFVARATAEGGRCLVIPFRVFGLGPYAGVLEGLDYEADSRGLLQHPAVIRWLARQAATLRSGSFDSPKSAYR
jgi:hypothetical protein